MKIDHIAIWCKNLEKMKQFYCTFFQGVSNTLYHNTNRNFKSYFISFGTNKCRIELMSQPHITNTEDSLRGFSMGIAHFCMELSSKNEVLSLTEILRNEGYTILSEPRTIGDGYFESAVADPKGNYVEISA